ncbi:ECF transporter S component [bacterium]|nr:ECF transporter S component [bacterium]NUN46891.1 ECF transporter S component [bacterium]
MSASEAQTLALQGVKAYTLQIIFVLVAVLLPIGMHFIGAPVRIMLPMHWPIILAGLVYGWRAGTIAGIFAPILSYIVSGYPLPSILPSMTVELMIYGLSIGLMREKTSINKFACVLMGLIFGRIAFIVCALLTYVPESNAVEYFEVALLPGVWAAVGQIVMLPILSSWWIRQDNS